MKQRIPKLLPESDLRNDRPGPSYCCGKSRLVIYDFDNTIFHSPERETGEILYLEKSGEEWPFQGWYGRLETLMPPLVPEIPGPEFFIQETVESIFKDSNDKNSYVVLMTGRPYKIRRRIQSILDSQNLHFDEEHYRGNPIHPKGSSTFEIKFAILSRWLIHSKLDILEIWEDRPEHASAFIRGIKSKYIKDLKKFVMHDPVNNTHLEFIP